MASKVYRQSWADKGYEPHDHHYLITRISMVRELPPERPSLHLIHDLLSLSPCCVRVCASEQEGGVGHPLLEG